MIEFMFYTMLKFAFAAYLGLVVGEEVWRLFTK
jgi:hypothetical protein